MDKEKLIKSAKIAICIVSFLVCAIGIYSISKNLKEYRNLDREQEVLEKQASAAKEEFDEYKQHVQEKAYEEAKEGDSEEAGEVATHNSSSLIMSNLSESFFKGYFTWNDGETYRDRADKVSSIATKEIVNNEELFDDGKDSLGGDYVETRGIKSEFVDAEAYPEDDNNSLVKVTYTSWFHDEKSKSSESTRYYYVTFNRDNQKITNLELVFSSGN